MRKTKAQGRGLKLPSAMDRQGKFAKLYAALREAIADGRLPAGTRLPSTRDLARQQVVARGTVVAVFEQLTADGFLASRIGDGTYVRAALRVARPAADGRRSFTKPPVLSIHYSPFLTGGNGGLRPFRANTPAIDLFPRAAWARLSARCWRQASPDGLGDGDPRGQLRLRQVLSEYLALSRGVRSEVEQVFIVPGTQAALDLVCRAVLQSGDTVWVEDPGYVGARQLLRQWGATVTAMAVDDEGMQVPANVPASKQPRLIVVTPAHQSPLGVTMSLPRRLALMEQAGRAGAWIFEDDYDGELRYGSRPLSALQGIDQGGRVIHAGTFSKTLLPSLRLGYMIVPERLVDPLMSLMSLTWRFVAPMEQAVLAEFIGLGHFGRHIRRLQEAYATRHAVLRSECARLLSGMIELNTAAAGLDVIAWLPPRCSDTEVSQTLMSVGIEARPLSQYRIRRGRPGLVLGAAAFDEATIRTAVGRMAAALASLQPKGRPRRA